jgi:hypothetical protein
VAGLRGAPRPVQSQLRPWGDAQTAQRSAGQSAPGQSPAGVEHLDRVRAERNVHPRANRVQVYAEARQQRPVVQAATGGQVAVERVAHRRGR